MLEIAIFYGENLDLCLSTCYLFRLHGAGESAAWDEMAPQSPGGEGRRVRVLPEANSRTKSATAASTRTKSATAASTQEACMVTSASAEADKAYVCSSIQ